MHKLSFYLLMLFLIGGLLIGEPALAQTDDPPIVFVTHTEIYRWDEANGLELVVPIPQMNLQNSNRLTAQIWHGLTLSPDRQYLAFMEITPEWQGLVERNEVEDGENASNNVYLLELATGTKIAIAVQEPDEPRAQLKRWSLTWSTDGRYLLWLEGEGGDLIRHDLNSGITIALVENAAPYTSGIRGATQDRIIVTDGQNGRQINNFSIYDMDGTLISHIGAFEFEGFPVTYLYHDDNALYVGTDLQRANIETGEMSETPTGQLIRVAPDAIDRSLRILPEFNEGNGCVADVVGSEGNFVTQILMDNPPYFSPDGQAILYRDYEINRYVLVRVDESGEVERIELPEIPGPPYGVFWRTPVYIFEHTSEPFAGLLGCGAG